MYKLPDESSIMSEFLEFLRYGKSPVTFTGDHIRYGSAMKRVIKAWPRTMINSLTNKGINRRAFLGHCACTFEFNCPEYITRMAWKRLTNDQRYLADKVAQETINKWCVDYEEKNRGIYKDVGEQMLFEWAT